MSRRKVPTLYPWPLEYFYPAATAPVEVAPVDDDVEWTARLPPKVVKAIVARATNATMRASLTARIRVTSMPRTTMKRDPEKASPPKGAATTPCLFSYVCNGRPFSESVYAV